MNPKTSRRLKPGPRKNNEAKLDLSDAFDPNKIETLEALSGYGLTEYQIAAVMRISSDTFRRMKKAQPELQEAIDRGKARTERDVMKTAYRMATNGRNTAMTIFWLKTRCRWKDVSVPGDNSGQTVNNFTQNNMVLHMSNQELIDSMNQAKEHLALDPALRPRLHE